MAGYPQVRGYPQNGRVLPQCVRVGEGGGAPKITQATTHIEMKFSTVGKLSGP